MSQLATIFGSEVLALWQHAQKLEIFTVDWARIRDPNAPKKGKYSVSLSCTLPADDVGLWRALIAQDTSWALDAQTRHRLTPTHLISVETSSSSMLLLFSERGKQLGFEKEGLLLFADLHPTTVTVISSWLPKLEASTPSFDSKVSPSVLPPQSENS